MAQYVIAGDSVPGERKATKRVVGPGSGLMTGSEMIMTQYGLTAAGCRLRVAPAQEWATCLAEANADGK